MSVSPSVLTQVKDQGDCGSCWAFSATGALEGQRFKKDGLLTALSEQQLMDCSWAYDNYGCNGGKVDRAFDYVANNGICAENDYSYLSYVSGHVSKAPPATCISLYHIILQPLYTSCE